MIRGDREGAYPGARLWNLDKLRRDWQKTDATQSSNDCVQQVLKQATDDQKEYWDYIGKKYRCDGPPEGRDPQRCASVQENRAYLGFIGIVLSEIQNIERQRDCAQNADANTPSPQVQALVQDIAKTIEPPIEKNSEPTCDHIPDEERRRERQSALIPNYRLPYDCAVGIWKQIMSELNSIKMLGESVVGWFRGGMNTGMANLWRAWKEDPLLFGKMTEIVTSVWHYLSEDFADFACYNDIAQNEKVCKFATKVGLAYLTGGALTQLQFYKVLGKVGGGLAQVKSASTNIAANAVQAGAVQASALAAASKTMVVGSEAAAAAGTVTAPTLAAKREVLLMSLVPDEAKIAATGAGGTGASAAGASTAGASTTAGSAVVSVQEGGKTLVLTQAPPKPGNVYVVKDGTLTPVDAASASGASAGGAGASGAGASTGASGSSTMGSIGTTTPKGDMAALQAPLKPNRVMSSNGISLSTGATDLTGSSFGSVKPKAELGTSLKPTQVTVAEAGEAYAANPGAVLGRMAETNAAVAVQVSEQAIFKQFREQIGGMKDYGNGTKWAKDRTPSPKDCLGLSRYASSLTRNFTPRLKDIGFASAQVEINFAYAQRAAAVGCTDSMVKEGLKAEAAESKKKSIVTLENAKKAAKSSMKGIVNTAPGALIQDVQSEAEVMPALEELRRQQQEERERRYEEAEKRKSAQAESAASEEAAAAAQAAQGGAPAAGNPEKK